MVRFGVLLASAMALLIASPSAAAKLEFVVTPANEFFGTFEQEFRYSWTVGPLAINSGLVTGAASPSNTPYSDFLKDRAGLSSDVTIPGFYLFVPRVQDFNLPPTPLQIFFGGSSSNTVPRYTHELMYNCMPSPFPFDRPCPVYNGDYSDIRQIANFLDGKLLTYAESSQREFGGLTYTGYLGNARIDLAASEFDPISGVPEPSVWAMMLGGFGLVGIIARRRYKVAIPFVQ